MKFNVKLISTALSALTLFGCANNNTDSKTSSETTVRRIGFVAGAGSFEKMAVTNRTFFDALGESGYVHGKTMEVVFRTAEGDMTKMPSLVEDVLRNNVHRHQVPVDELLIPVRLKQPSRAHSQRLFFPTGREGTFGRLRTPHLAQKIGPRLR